MENKVVASQEQTKILFTTSTMPSSDDDPVPAFVKDEAIWLHNLYPNLSISILAPHNAYKNLKRFQQTKDYGEYRFHYFWPYRWEFLTGRGIEPALRKNKLLYFELPGLFLGEFFATLRLVKSLRPDIIYAHWFTPQALTGALVAKLTRTPFVFDTQASDAIVLKHIPFSKKIVAWVCKQAIAYTVPSQQTLDKLLYFSTEKNKKQILSKVHMVPYGTSQYPVTKKETASATKLYDLDDKEIIYFIGRLVERKGVDILLRAFAQLDNSNDRLRLVIVGDGQNRSNLEHLAKELKIQHSVVFTGFLTGDVRYGLLSAATICVIPSVNVGDQSEGLPVVFMEATLEGKITVISDATGAHEISDNGKNAIIVKSGSVNELLGGINKALKISRKNDGTFREEVLKLSKTFEWSYVARKRYDALIKPVTEKKYAK